MCHPDDSLIHHLADVRAKGKVVNQLAKKQDYLPTEKQTNVVVPSTATSPHTSSSPLGCIDLLLTKYKQGWDQSRVCVKLHLEHSGGPGDPAERSSWTLVVGKPRTELRQQPPGLRRSPRVHLPSPATCSRPNINVPQGKCTLKMLLCLMGNVSKLSESTFIPR